MFFHTARVLFVFSLIGAGCSSAPKFQSIEKIDDKKALPTELSEKFQVEEVGAVAPPKVETEKKVVAKKAPQKKPKKKKATVVKKEEKKFEFPFRRPTHWPFTLGEKLEYEITYFGVVAGVLTVWVDSYKQVNGRKTILLKGRIKSSALSSLFYRLNDTVESYVDFDGVFSHRFRLVLDESKQQRDTLELYDSEKKQSYLWDRWSHHKKGYREKKEYHTIPAFTQDILSAIYFSRIQLMTNSGKIEFPIVSEGKTFEIGLEHVKRERMKTPLGRVWTNVVKPELTKKGSQKKPGQFKLWFTDDSSRFLVRMEAKVKIGTVAVQLKKVKKGIPLQ